MSEEETIGRSGAEYASARKRLICLKKRQEDWRLAMVAATKRLANETPSATIDPSRRLALPTQADIDDLLADIEQVAATVDRLADVLTGLGVPVASTS